MHGLNLSSPVILATAVCLWLAITTTACLPPPRPSVSPVVTAQAKPTQPPAPERQVAQAQEIGVSTNGWPLEVYQFGNGPTRLALIGGIHGGYEWNTILLAYRMIDYFNENPDLVPPSVTLFILPSANPDGQVAVVGQAGPFEPAQVGDDPTIGRFNGRDVDLNRNWDCNWSPTARWRDREISGGTAAFSEVENQLLRDFLTEPPMDGVVFWHSAAPGIFPGGCNERFAGADYLGRIYADASGYPFAESFTAYPVTGDATDWLSLLGIPAFSAELHNHSELDWEENIQGVLALLNHFSQE